MTIKEIADKINAGKASYKIGQLQQIRKKIKELDRMPTSDIFSDKSISDYWAFHTGGRKELQFNIGLEEEFRYGVAFSLEKSRSLPEPEILYPKIFKLNTIIAENTSFFKNYSMWHWQNGTRSHTYNVDQIPASIVSHGNFIFIGKIMPLDSININEILTTFDELLTIYLEIETNPLQVCKIKTTPAPVKIFAFNNGVRNLPQNISYTSLEKQINIEARHTLLQEKLIEHLSSIYGRESVGVENYLGTKKIDVAVKHNNEYIFYEIKTASSAKACVRQAIGQLLEYSYFTGERIAVKIVVVGEYDIDPETSNYLRFLHNEFNLPIDYLSIK